MVGRNRRGNATKIMAMADGNGLPISATIAAGQCHEAPLVDELVDKRFIKATPTRLVCDKAYDSAPLSKRLEARNIELIAPKISRAHQRRPRGGRRQDGRSLRRYRRRWKVERLFSWLFNFRRLVTRYEYKAENFLGFVHMGCLMILLRHST
jgi:transposase